MLDVNPAMMTRYLNVHQEKYRSKGVDSVRSRVINLRELSTDITIDSMKNSLIKAFETEYQGTVRPVPKEWLPAELLQSRKKRFASWDWVYGRPVKCSWMGEQRFPWGLLRVEMDVHGGVVRDLGVFTDAMEVDVFQTIESALKGQRFERNAVLSTVEQGMQDSDYASALKTLLESAF